MRIAVLGSRHILSNYSGIERVLRSYLPHLVRRGHDVTVFSGPLPDGTQVKDEDAALWQGVRSVIIKGAEGKHSETLARTAFSAAKVLRRNFDVVHFVAQGPGIFSPFMRLVGVPTVVTVPGLDWQRAKWGRLAQAAIRTAERVAVSNADELIVLSHSVQRYFGETYGRRTVLIPNGMNRDAATRDRAADREMLTRFCLQPNHYALFAARLVPEKACHELIEAWNKVETDMQLVVAGGGRYNGDYVQRLHAMARPGRVVFTGHLEGETLQALFAQAYLFVLPSHLEGQSVALLEALGHGRATLVSDIAENLEVIEDNGFRFSVGDVAGLRHLLTSLIGDPARVAAMAERARQAAEARPCWQTVALMHEEVYASVIDRAVSRYGRRAGSAPAVR